MFKRILAGTVFCLLALVPIFMVSGAPQNAAKKSHSATYTVVLDCNAAATATVADITLSSGYTFGPFVCYSNGSGKSSVKITDPTGGTVSWGFTGYTEGFTSQSCGADSSGFSIGDVEPCSGGSSTLTVK